MRQPEAQDLMASYSNFEAFESTALRGSKTHDCTVAPIPHGLLSCWEGSHVALRPLGCSFMLDAFAARFTRVFMDGQFSRTCSLSVHGSFCLLVGISSPVGSRSPRVAYPIPRRPTPPLRRQIESQAGVGRWVQPRPLRPRPY